MTNKVEETQRPSPAEKARLLAEKAQKERAQQEQQAREERFQGYVELRDRLKALEDRSTGLERELLSIQEGLDEIARVAESGTMSDELKDLQNQLEVSRNELEVEKINLDLDKQEIENNPLYTEGQEIEKIQEADEAQKQREQETERAQKESRERIEQLIRGVDLAIHEMTEALKVAETREGDIRALRGEKTVLEQKKQELSKGLETDIAGVLYVIPEKQQQAIQEAVTKARETGTRIYTSDIGAFDQRFVHRPAAGTMSEWFSSWKEKVTPSFLPFADKPLRALLAFATDPRLGELQTVDAQSTVLTEKEKALFADRQETNIAFIERFLAQTAPLLNFSSLNEIRRADNLDQDLVGEKLRKLAQVSKGFSLLLADVGSERYRQFEQSGVLLGNDIEKNFLY
jgi:myosin heavy subunit